MDVQGCHLLIASVKMGPQRGRLKFTTLALNLHSAVPPVTYTVDNDNTDGNSAAVHSSLAEGLACVQLAHWAEMSLLFFWHSCIIHLEVTQICSKGDILCIFVDKKQDLSC